MKFLARSQLTKAIRRLIASKRPIKAAIAYWGSGAFETLGLDSRRKNVKVICCLANGKSDPNVISKFAKRARQNDRLHAKVIWTPTAAIVGSANASSNGLPEEENKTVGLVEAGILIDDKELLKEIGSWFDSEFKKAARITKLDLKQAKEARDRRIL